ncbi:type I secretion system permease/ATPase [Desulfofustis limnaeus]|jgi:ATP-binding cassette subfamily C protein LapB|uniref:ABC transporter n=1 Tax=Desulfofustis limnaeus TaxID=2740163 RepID=A0ABN6MAK9_9BACT|nr:type I secretion system permease/ATPase [Desulfofustis limnaeus]MDX9894519.1 type I secretion system permease/ATPase [Desulfofustis sp.]BDD88603.1 ABC transporter [Desulfofustis limnaeus]
MTKNNNTTTTESWQITSDSDSFDDPLLDCLVILSSVYERPTSPIALRAGLPLVENRLTVELVPRAARRAGLATRLLKRSLASLRNVELPAILLLNDRRACIVRQVNRSTGEALVIWPQSGGSATLKLEDLQEEYTGHTIFVKPKFQVDDRLASNTETNEKNWFWSTVLSSWKIYRDVLVASFLINVFALVTPIFIINVYDRIIPNLAFETLWVLSSGVLIIYLFELVMRGLRGYFIDSAGKKSNVILSSILFEKVMSLRLEARPKSIGSFAKRLQQFESIRDFITSISITALVDLPFVFIFLAAIFYIGGHLIWIHITAILLLLGYALIVQIPLKKAVRLSFSADAQKNAVLVEGLSGLETIKTLGAESKIQRAWEESVSYIANWTARSRFLATSVTHVAGFLQNISIVAVIIGSLYLIAQGQLTGGGMIACVILSRRAIFPMAQVVSLMTRYHQASNSLKSLNKIMSLPSERSPDKKFLHRVSIKGDITVSNLSFAYPETTKEVLRSINFQVKAGEHIGIIGPIGSGKTTLGKLLLGLYQPTGGSVSIDGTDIRQIDPADLRAFIGYVPQDITLFRGTLRDNIMLGTTGVADSAILRAADVAGVSQFIANQSHGFDMPIEEQGRNLSGGQRQNIAIARAILLDPPILIMDEPTSSMDSRNESMLKNNLKNIIQGRTTIIITHRLSMLEMVDRIIVLSKETIVADGTKQRIMEALQNGHLSV